MAIVEERERDASTRRCMHPARPGAVGPDPPGIPQGKDADPRGNEALEHPGHGNMELQAAIQRGVSGEALIFVTTQCLLAAEKGR
jgi:hypothetical protein